MRSIPNKPLLTLTELDVVFPDLGYQRLRSLLYSGAFKGAHRGLNPNGAGIRQWLIPRESVVAYALCLDAGFTPISEVFHV